MTNIATGPGGNILIALFPTEVAAEAAQARAFRNERHNHADRHPSIREQIVAEEIDVDDVTLDAKGITVRWAIPAQVPEGPHAGDWYIPVPADETRRFQRDPRTGDITERPAPEWAGVEIVERDDAWFPVDEEAV